MPKKRYTAEEIINKLRQAEVLLSQGKSVTPRASARASEEPRSERGGNRGSGSKNWDSDGFRIS